MKKVLSIEPFSTTYYDDLERHGDYGVQDVDGWKTFPDGTKGNITKLGCKINGEEPKGVYTMFSFLEAMNPTYKGDRQFGFSFASFLTCSCGHGGCAGYHDNVVIRRKKNTVMVVGKKEDGYNEGVVLTGESVVYFDKEQWDGVLDHYLKLFKENPDGVFEDTGFMFTGRWGTKNFSK